MKTATFHHFVNNAFSSRTRNMFLVTDFWLQTGTCLKGTKTRPWSLRACPISKSVRFSSVLISELQQKYYFTRIPLQNLFRFHFCVPFSSIKSYNNSCKVFSRSEQETGKRKHKEPPINPRSKKIS